MEWKLQSPGFAALAFIGLALLGTRCADKKTEFTPPTEAELDTSDHDLLTKSGEPIAEPVIEANQNQSIDPPEAAQAVDPNPCKTRFPILLVHGVALRDAVLGQNYFGRIPNHLKSKCKVDVYQGGQDAFSIIDVNADQLKDRILYLTDTLGYKKINVIAHSKGGLDIRFMFYKYKGLTINGRSLNDRVASFTTLSTPHRGSVLADYLLERFDKLSEKLVFIALDIFGFSQKDSKASSAEQSMTALSPKVMEEWNAKMGDLARGIPDVYCQSWAANISGYIQDPALWTTSKMMASVGTKINDGAVDEPSAIYGNYRGVVGHGMFGGVSHFAIVDRALGIAPGITPGFNVLTFYTDMLADLKEKGF